MAGLTGFSFYKTITISHANADADLTNFPVYVPIVNDADIGGECLATGYDIQFADATNDNVLTFERLAGFAVTGGQANGDFYVLVPTVAGASDTVIRCYYGKAGATDASNPSGTFATANGWTAVWHLEEAAGSNLDATTNNMDVTSVTSDPVSATGKIGNGIDFDTTDNMIIADGCPTIFPDSPISIEFWYKNTTAASNYMRLLCNQSGTFVINRRTADTDIGFQLGANLNAFTITTIFDGSWHHCLFTYVYGASGVKKFYRDGVQDGGDQARNESFPDLTAEDFLFSGTDSSYMANGTLDEVRVSNTVQTAEYTKFNFYNSHDGHAAGNELTWGAETAAATNVTVTPAVQAKGFILNTVAIVTDAIISAAVIVGSFALPAPTIVTDALVSPSVVTGNFNLIASPVASDIVLTPNSAIDVSSSIPTPTITTTVGGEALARTGYVSYASSLNSSSQNITIPNDTTFALLFIHGYNTGGATWTSLTLDGVAMASSEGTNYAGTYLDTWVYSLANPPTGTVSFAWNFTGTSNFTNGCWFNFVFLKNQAATSPIRDSGVGTDGTIVLTALEHDLVIGGVGSLGGDANAAPTGSGQTEFLDTASSNGVESACGDESATGGAASWTYSGLGTKTSAGAVSIVPSAGVVTVVPNAIVGTLGICVPTLSGGASYTPTVLSRALEVVAPDVVIEGPPSESITVYPDVVNGNLSIQTPTILGNSLTTPSVLTGNFTLPDATLSMGVTPEITELIGTFTVNDVTLVGGLTVSPTVVVGVFTIPTPVIITEGDVVVSPDVVTGNFALPAPEVLTQAVLVEPVQAVTATIPAPTVIGNALVEVAKIGGTFSIPEPSIYVNVLHTPDVLVGSFSLPDTTIIGHVLHEADVVEGAFSTPAPTILTNTQTVEPSVVSLIASIPTPTIVTQFYTSLHAVKFYLGTNTGGVYEYGSGFKGDAGEVILAYWHSKNLDFSDQRAESADLVKTIEKVKLFYVDTNETDVMVSVSNDDGLTWTDVTHTIGSGTNDPAECDFHFWLSGKEFRFKLTHASASDNFQWVRMEILFVPQGEHF